MLFRQMIMIQFYSIIEIVGLMQVKFSPAVCKISNIQFTVQARQKEQNNNRITFRHKKKQKKQAPETDSQISMIRKHIESFLPVSCCNPKKTVALNFNTCHREMKPIKGLELTYKRFPIRKALSTSSMSSSRKEKKFCMGPENSVVFSNKIINESIYNSPQKTQVKTPDITRAGSAYTRRRRSLPCTFETPLTL